MADHAREQPASASHQSQGLLLTLPLPLLQLPVAVQLPISATAGADSQAPQLFHLVLCMLNVEAAEQAQRSTALLHLLPGKGQARLTFSFGGMSFVRRRCCGHLLSLPLMVLVAMAFLQSLPLHLPLPLTSFPLHRAF